MAVYAYGKTEKCSLDFNEDAIMIEKIQDYLVMIVADGNGGKQGCINVGMLCATTMMNYLKKVIKRTTTIIDIRDSMDMGMYLCSRVMLGVNASSEPLSNAYTSMTCVIVSEASHELVYASIGNTELQLYRRFQFTRMSRVHSEAYDLLMKGECKEEDFYVHPKRAILTSALGGFEDIQVDIMQGKLQNEDILFIVSDGIFRHMTPNEMIDFMAQQEINQGVDNVLQQCVERGGYDNCSLICCYISD